MSSFFLKTLVMDSDLPHAIYQMYYDHTIRWTYLGHQGHGTSPTFTTAFSKSEYRIAFSFPKLNNPSSSDHSRVLGYWLPSAFTSGLFWVTPGVTLCSLQTGNGVPAGSLPGTRSWCPEPCLHTAGMASTPGGGGTLVCHTRVISSSIPRQIPPKRRALHRPYWTLD